MAPERLLPRREVVALTGLIPREIEHLLDAGTFPEPIAVGANGSQREMWVGSEIDGWIQRTITEARRANDIVGKMDALYGPK